MEYLFLAALIAVVCLVAVTYFGKSVNSNISKSGSAIDSVR